MSSYELLDCLMSLCTKGTLKIREFQQHDFLLRRTSGWGVTNHRLGISFHFLQKSLLCLLLLALLFLLVRLDRLDNHLWIVANDLQNLGLQLCIRWLTAACLGG